MVINYEGEEYTFDLEEIDVAQASIIYQKFGLTLLGLENALAEGNPYALKAMYWLMLCQNGKKANIETVNFKIVKFARAVDEAGKPDEDESSEEKDAAPKG